MCYFITRDVHLIDTVKDTGFQNTINVFEPRRTSSARKTITMHYLPQKFHTKKECIVKLVGCTRYFTITTGLWTFKAKHAYTGLTVTSQRNLACRATRWPPKSFLTFTQQTHCRGAGGHSWWVEALSRWTLCCYYWQWHQVFVMNVQMPCFSHTLQPAVERAVSLPEVSKALGHCWCLVLHFNHSLNSKYLLKQKQEYCHHPKHSLIKDVATCWNSPFYMVQQVSE